MKYSTFEHKAVLLVAILLCSMYGGTPAFAQNTTVTGENCPKGEYVISVSTVPALKNKELQAATAISSGNLEVIDQAARIVLVKDRKEARSLTRSAVDLCGKIKVRRREVLRQVRETGESQILRNIQCSCNATLSIAATPNDPYYSIEWGLNQSNNIDMNLPEAWDISTGDPNTVVAVIDTGIDYNHEDLKDNLWTNPNEIPGNGIDDDSNGYIDDVHGANMITGSGDPLDDHGHGTHVSGTIGARSNNGIGVAGINWRVKVMGVKFLSNTGNGSLYDAVRGLDYVTAMKNRGVNVILTNNSWGGGGFYPSLSDAIVRSKNAGLLFVAAAGNSASNNDAVPSYPSGYQIDNIIAVVALDTNGNLASFSCYGANTVHIAAPGANIASTYPGNRYVYMSGTSMATPHISGVLALAYSQAGWLNYLGLKNLLFNSARPLASLSGLISTGRMADAYQMLATARMMPPGQTPPPYGTVAPSPTAAPGPTVAPTPPAGPTPTPTPTPPPAQPGPYSITGRVLVADSSGSHAAEGAIVRLSSDAGEWLRRVDVSGDYNFTNIANNPINYRIDISYGGYTFNSASGHLDSNRTLDFSSSATSYKVEVLVIDKFKQPIVSAVVNAGTLGSFLTDSSGIALISAPYGVDYQIGIAAAGMSFDHSQLKGTVFGDLKRVVAGVPG